MPKRRTGRITRPGRGVVVPPSHQLPSARRPLPHIQTLGCLRRLTPPYGTRRPRRRARTHGIPQRRAQTCGIPRHQPPPRRTRRPRAPPPDIPRHRPTPMPRPRPHVPPRRPLPPLPRSPQRPPCRVGRSRIGVGVGPPGLDLRRQGLGIRLPVRLLHARIRGGVREPLVRGHLPLPRLLRLPTFRTPPLPHPAHDSLRSDTRSDSSRAVSSVRADSPEPRIASAKARLDSSISAMRSSTVPSVMRRWTWTGWVWPMR